MEIAGHTRSNCAMKPAPTSVIFELPDRSRDCRQPGLLYEHTHTQQENR